jgi:hypothetical protein
VGHSLGWLILSCERRWFVPHPRSILAQGFEVKSGEVASIEVSDSWLRRGAVNVRLSTRIWIEVAFRNDPDLVVPGMERPVSTAPTPSGRPLTRAAGREWPRALAGGSRDVRGRGCRHRAARAMRQKTTVTELEAAPSPPFSCTW